MSDGRTGGGAANTGAAYRTRSEELELLRDLIAIDSVNPALVPGGAGESRIADAVVAWLSPRGFECRRLETTPGRPSIVAIARGTGGGRSLMLNGHLDTVSLASYDGDGLAPVVRDGRLHGRGAYDMKSGLAAMMVAAAGAHGTPHRGDVVLALVADEEHASLGTEDVLEHVVTDGAVVVEPTGLDLVTSHRGFAWATVTVHGRAAHGSRPDLGVDAIAKAGRLLTAIDDLGARLAAGTRHPLLGTGSMHAGTITGGAEPSSYPGSCTVTIERRTIPGEDHLTFERELRGILDELARTDAAFTADLAITTHRGTFEAGVASEVAAAVGASFGEVTGREPARRGEPFWTDCALLAAAGIDTIMFGVDGGGAHAADEWVDLDSLIVVTATLERTIARYVG
ncbi:M20/M25/M40 family metallo-hydrolase [Agromyces mariniharenae]|uniref:M20/M25/M40 family metallo-hydrolase n=1 Tax=Agromyces mariniharenae TaxID=2604423 RepID=A0A5S4UXR0_9MICO|nr:M20/M25/M40 family metallo-hydrolase [Agromyces mariniharenae]TYL50489.1 M20/M25/M40 family metallo-hydrolase [Agromyces mariniharenae]